MNADYAHLAVYRIFFKGDAAMKRWLQVSLKHYKEQQKEASTLCATFLGNGLNFPRDRRRYTTVLSIQTTDLVMFLKRSCKA